MQQHRAQLPSAPMANSPLPGNNFNASALPKIAVKASVGVAKPIAVYIRVNFQESPIPFHQRIRR